MADLVREYTSCESASVGYTYRSVCVCWSQFSRHFIRRGAPWLMVGVSQHTAFKVCLSLSMGCTRLRAELG